MGVEIWAMGERLPQFVSFQAPGSIIIQGSLNEVEQWRYIVYISTVHYKCGTELHRTFHTFHSYCPF